MYFSDTPTSTVWRFEYNLEDGTIENRNVFREFIADEGRPDGAFVDAEGYYWVACGDQGKVFRLAPDGRINRTIQMPLNYPTMCVFGGAGRSTLFTTTLSWRPINNQSTGEKLAGGLFQSGVDAIGLPETKDSCAMTRSALVTPEIHG